MQDQASLDQIFSALSNSTRRAILARLSQGDASVSELASPFDMSLAAISKHIKVLEKAGLISQGQDAQFRPCKLTPKPLQQLASWTDQYRPIWEARFDMMDQCLKNLTETDNDTR